MKIGIAGPMSLRLLNYDFGNLNSIPTGQDYTLLTVLINALLNRGHQVVAYTTSTGIRRPVIYQGDDLTICIAGSRDRHRARDFFKSERKGLVELMRSYSVDIMNAHWSYEYAWAALDSKIPTLVTLHDHALTILRYQLDGYRLMRFIMNYIVLSRVAYLSVNSQHLFNLLGKRNKKRALIIPNFYSRDLKGDCSKPNEKSNFILSVSNGFGRLKNISTALWAFSLIRRRRPDIEYHLVGDGMEMGGPAYQYAMKNKIMDGVHFIGQLANQEVINKVRGALVFLHPSREESFGMSVLEAMVIGTPVVGGYRSGNIPHLLDDGRAGVLCNIDSPKEIAREVLKVLTNADLSEKLISQARKFAQKKFNQEVAISAYEGYYAKIIGEVA